MDATRWMPRIGAACAAVMLLALAVPASGSAASTVSYDGTAIRYVDAANAVDVVRVEIDEDAGQNPAFAFLPTLPTTLTNGSGCETNSNAIHVCPLQAQRLIFELGGADDLVDLSSAELNGANARPTSVQGGSGADQLKTGPGDDAFVGGAGSDTLIGINGRDDFTGGPDADELVFETGGPWHVSLDDVANDGGATPLANIHSDVEVLRGGTLGDTLTGAAGGQVIEGRGGPDTIDGGPDADVLRGGDGDDTILARDGAVDEITCGIGTDTVTADWNDLVADCETVTRSVRDDDGDGAPHDLDCNDAAATIRPGAGDIPGNGVDEDCDGVDAVLDRDGDGAVAGVDCDDANPARRPGAVDIPANGVDEDCNGADAKRAVVTATFSASWSVFGDYTKLTKLTVKGAPAGAKLQVRCAGKGCPFARKSVKLKRGGANLSKRFKGAKLRPGAVVELRVTAGGTVGRVQRITIRKRKGPKRSSLCLRPGASKPSRCA